MQGIGEELESFFEGIVKRIEIVSEHFNYLEEYVMDHHVFWIDRKFEQAERSRWNSRMLRQWDDFNRATAVEKWKNGDKDFELGLMDEFDAAPRTASGAKAEHDQSDFITDPMALMPHLKLDEQSS